MVTLLFGSAMLFSCSSHEEAETEKGAIEKMTEKTAEEMADRIRVPLEKARDARKLVEERYRDMEETLKEENKE
jgi:hypothetical protein